MEKKKFLSCYKNQATDFSCEDSAYEYASILLLTWSVGIGL